ncbi:transglutaminase-like domain-containing protein [Paraburkholderia sp. D15]|uniref:transglutaminase-like domain-containing protein n=1 Tax=Paraburkholderia sp. D15 TaxID=2880218 RepID=UPI002479CF76|nr:transglutaminase-like domain-containing protein [Paraburkholderia sp. D15]WGS52277.1 transglutaminase-like domain-containing protein [Paraburkholderia sp. D15]WKF59439.1 hypothetical protein HUO10_003950 [Paraburkholderia busanensis]
MSDHVARYREQSSVTAVHPYEAELDNLPRTVSELVDKVDGLIIHFETDKAALDEQILLKRRHEVDSRFASTMLHRIFSLDSSPLGEPRPVERRLLGTCRDTAVMLCSFMRHQGIPARVRFGFAHMLYQQANPLHNHAVVEYWNGNEWLLAESRMPYVRGSDTPFSPDDLPRAQFMVGAEAWRQLRNGERSAQTFSGHRLGEHPSAWLVRSFALYDLASLAGYEPLMWDQWGRHYNFCRPRRAFNDGELLDLLDQAITTDCRIDTQCEQLVERFRQVTGIADGTEIHSFSPVLGRYSIKA